jgi:hypothetical protein
LAGVTLSHPTNFAGEIDFDMQMTTTETAGDSKTHAVKPVTVMVTPEVDMGMNTDTHTQDEDVSQDLNFDFVILDSDGADAGKEELISFGIDVTGLEAAGVTLVTAGGVDLTTGKSGYQVVTVTAGALEAVTATLPEDTASARITLIFFSLMSFNKKFKSTSGEK